jgi:hypothetical protein
MEMKSDFYFGALKEKMAARRHSVPLKIKTKFKPRYSPTQPEMMGPKLIPTA